MPAESHETSEMLDRYFADASDLVDRTGLTRRDVEQSLEVMRAMRNWRTAEEALANASKRYMKLNETDMRAIRLLIRAREQGEVVTPKDIARAVGISSASTTKLVDRLVAGGHVVRRPHPTDRRTVCIEVTESTRVAARESVGRQHARRFAVAAQLEPAERETVIRFLSRLAEADVPVGPLSEVATDDVEL
ncbi:DNA-binding transcriptional regulator, MarR family [Paramicrobacterium humi]|uniref:DNA-binding transcriptional regulator, MarR family n=1 Tax=Paramicrobacterium humi TaxID=640635 RepID=A0A1H4N7T5_9MICO|nr:MarR family transcriptional regulator [Microbacterium humi]SEB91530.1 DNA-binding transcriptional regulator, MarR family [Microbacterium humi]